MSSVRVVEVIEGKSFVGIEIPNEKRDLVTLGEILRSKTFEEFSSPLTIALGKDIAGNPIVADLQKMPHLLIAGTTGSGKSVGINAMIISLLYKSTPKDVRMILIDPKMLELSVYGGIPHLLCPVVTDMSVTTGHRRCGMPPYTDNSSIFGSIRIIRTSFGVDLYSRLMIIALMPTDFPEPVVPAINK